MTKQESGYSRPIEERHGFIRTDGYGVPTRRLACKYPNPELTVKYPNGRIIVQHPLVVASSADPKNAECKAVDGSIPTTSIVTGVSREMCELQIELGECPRGLTLEDIAVLRK